ncbi:MAG: hypothetical protein JHD19_04385 [Pseudomonas sp.]|uniref:hypothetical protein n=1 Tax=Pseudomonas sp. TaxID=306 RepID=UPI001A1C6752|nr:hypothetical protein [Pseudomonas sp.]MBJ7370672.1 hypothetical protein [Pseudomonas sp.]
MLSSVFPYSLIKIVSQERELQLEQALLAVLAALGQKGASIEDACAMAVGGLMSDGYWQWAEPEYREGAADEIDKAITRLSGTRPPSDINSDERWVSAC